MRAQPQTPQPKPGVAVGDDVYFQHPSGPMVGRVLSTGTHGIIARCGKDDHKVHWHNVLGQKRRSMQKFQVVDHGEDGLIVKDAEGRRRYVGIPPEARTEKLFVKSEDGARRLQMLLKGGPIANRAGLALRDVTDKTGRHEKRWMRTAPDQPGQKREAKPQDAKQKRGAAAGYGTHNLEQGDSVEFEAGDFHGKGEITAVGKDGVTVKDSAGRSHGVHWHEIRGHTPAAGTKKPEHATSVLGEQKPIPADQFDAAAYAQQHDKADVTPEEVLSHFPADTTKKMQDVQGRLAKVEQTIDEFKKDGTYTAGRSKLHDKILESLFPEDKIKAATPAPGEKPTFTILGGRGGSGKSWFEGNVYDPAKCIVLDADHIKGQLPEYEGWNAAQVHEESGEIFDRAVQLARDLGLNVVLDKTMKSAKSAINDVKAFKDAGYRTEAHYMHLPRQEAAKRAVARFLGKTQRYVPVEVVLSNTSNEHSFDQVKHLVDGWSFRDNNVPQGKPPVLISESGAAAKGGKDLRKSDHGHTIWLWRLKP